MAYSPAAVERAMTIHQAILHALHGRQTWLQVADVLGLSPRTVRRWRWKFERDGVKGLLDRRRQLPSARRVPVAELQRVLRLYRERYHGFNVRHFHQLARREHAVTFSYTLLKTALQDAGLVHKAGRAAGTGAGGSPARALGSCSTSTAVGTAG
jgi:transposase